MNLEGIAKAGEKAFRLISKESGTLEKLGETVSRNTLPRGVAGFEKVLAEGTNKAGEKCSIEMFTLKNAEGKVLKRTVNRNEGLDTFFKTSNYQHTGENSRFVHTNDFQNGHLVSSRQETINVSTDFDNKPVVARTIVGKKEINGRASLDTHFVGEFQNGEKPKELQFGFQRDKNGYIASSLTFEKVPKGILNRINTSDRYLPTYLNPNKSEVARDLLNSRLKKLGFPEMPQIKTFRKCENPAGKMEYGSARTYKLIANTEGEIEPAFIVPKIGINTLTSKLDIVDTIAHESKHLKQDQRIFDNDDILHMPEPVKSWWEPTIANKPTPKQGSKKYELTEAKMNANFELLMNEFKFSSGEISLDEHYNAYRNNPIEIEAWRAGARAQKHYKKHLDDFRWAFIHPDWERLSCPW